MMKILFSIYAILISLCGIFITIKRNFLQLSPYQVLLYNLSIVIIVIITICAVITENAWLEFFSLILGVIVTFTINRILIKSMKNK